MHNHLQGRADNDKNGVPGLKAAIANRMPSVAATMAVAEGSGTYNRECSQYE
jgi:hypothetical protein